MLNLPGVEEDVGLIGVHWQGQFIELVPWQGTLMWEVAPWGHWRIWGRNRDYEAVVEATAGLNEGTPLRAPTYDGLVPACKDTFFGKVSQVPAWRRLHPSLQVSSPRGQICIKVQACGTPALVTADGFRGSS